MKNFILFISIIFLSTGIACAFSNSLDGSGTSGVDKNQNFNKTPSSQTNNFQNRQNTPFNPKEHSGFEHQERQFPDASMNDTRYNSNCQFGTCTPGGINNNR